MSKLVAVVPFFFSSLLIATNANAFLIDLNNYNNINYQNSNLLISYGGGGGGKSPKAKANKKAKKEKVKLLFKKRQAAKKASQGIPLTEEEKKLLYIYKISGYEIKEN